MALVFDKCCGCIELKTGCLIIGYLQLVAEFILTITLFVLLVTGGFLAAQADDSQKVGGYVLLVFSGILTFFLILFLAFTITLLVGLHKDKRGHIKAYLIYAVIFYVIAVLSFFGSFAKSPIDWGQVFGNIFGLLVELYFLLVIRSYYLVLGDGSKGPAIYHNA